MGATRPQHETRSACPCSVFNRDGRVRRCSPAASGHRVEEEPVRAHGESLATAAHPFSVKEALCLVSAADSCRLF